MSDLAIVTDGTFAVIGLVLGLINMGVNHCPNDGCLAKSEQTPYLGLSVGDVVYQKDSVGYEIYLRKQTRNAYGPFQLAYGASVTEDGGFWAGMGASMTYTTPDKRWYAELHAMPGLYAKGNDEGLGGPIQFRTGIELGYQNRDGLRIGIGADHRSNADIYSHNPGLETVHLRISVPMR